MQNVQRGTVPSFRGSWQRIISLRSGAVDRVAAIPTGIANGRYEGMGRHCYLLKRTTADGVGNGHPPLPSADDRYLRLTRATEARSN